MWAWAKAIALTGLILVAATVYSSNKPSNPPTNTQTTAGSSLAAAVTTSTSQSTTSTSIVPSTTTSAPTTTIASMQTTTTTSSPPTTIPYDYWTVILVSLPSDTNIRADAEQMADEMTELGIEAHVLLSDDFPTLNPGYWVVHTGFYSDAQPARDLCEEVKDLVGYCYPRYVDKRPPSPTTTSPPRTTTTTWWFPYYSWYATSEATCQPDSVVVLTFDNYGDLRLIIEGATITEGFDETIVWQESGWALEVPAGGTAMRTIEMPGVAFEYPGYYWIEIFGRADGHETTNSSIAFCPFVP